MGKMASVSMVCFAAACATPYQEMGLRGGYEDHPIGGGLISVHVRGNGHTSAGTVMEYAYRRAGELCPSGFDVVDRNGSVRASWQASGDTVREVDRHELTMLVRCQPARESAVWVVQPQPKPQPEPKPQRQPVDCKPTGQIGLVTPATGWLPDWATTTDAVNAAVQFLVEGGNDIASRDVIAGTVVTKQTTGETLQSTCEANAYRALAFRVVFVGRSISVTMGCMGSFGWEAHVQGGVHMPAERWQSGPCTFVSAGDAKIPQLIVDGIVATLALSHSPAPSVP